MSARFAYFPVAPMARWMDPQTGTFLSVDPVVPQYDDPQSLNAYAYARNNPVTYNDPSGMCVIVSHCYQVQYGLGYGYAPSYSLTGQPLAPGQSITYTNDDLLSGNFSKAPVSQSSASSGGSLGGAEFAALPNPLMAEHSPDSVHVVPEGWTLQEARIAALGLELQEEGFSLEGLHELAMAANASASFVFGGGKGFAGFGAVTVMANGDLSINLGAGVGGGGLSAVSLTAQGEIQGGSMGAVRLEFIAGGAFGLGAIQRSSVSLTSAGAATGGGFLIGFGGVVFAGPTVSTPPLLNVFDLAGE